MTAIDRARASSQRLHAHFKGGDVTLRRKFDPGAGAKTVPAIFGSLTALEAASRGLEAGQVTISVSTLDLEEYRLDASTTVAQAPDEDAVQYAFSPFSGPMTGSTSDALSGATASVSGVLSLGG